jgi:hypothetical protein
MVCAVMRNRQSKQSDLHPLLIQTNIRSDTTNVASNGVPVASETHCLWGGRVHLPNGSDCRHMRGVLPVMRC